MSRLTGATPGEWTYSEYARLPDDGNRYEVIDGDVLVTPAPTPERSVWQWDAETGSDRPRKEAGHARWTLPGADTPLEADIEDLTAPL